MDSGGLTSLGPRSPRGRDNLGDIFQSIVKYREYPACGRYSQSYLIGGSYDAAFYCHYYSRLLVLIPKVVLREDKHDTDLIGHCRTEQWT